MQKGKVLLHPLNGDCFINHVPITTPGRLRQGKSASSTHLFSTQLLPVAGDLLQLGGSAVFRFNNPKEAKKLRKRHSVRECVLPVEPPHSEVLPLQEGLLDPNRLVQQHQHKRARIRSSPHTSFAPHTPSPPLTSAAVTVVELQSEAVVRASGPSPSPISFASSGSVPSCPHLHDNIFSPCRLQKRSQRSHLFLPL